MMKSARLVVFPTLSCLLFSLDACSRGGTLEERLSVVERHTHAAIDYVRQRWVHHHRNADKWSELGRQFDSQLEPIDDATDAELLQQARIGECCDARYKFVLLADYHDSNEARIGDIFEHFFSPKTGDRRFQVLPPPPMMSAEWARASDRLAWEYLLLRPSGANVPNNRFYGQRAIEALTSIGDPRSVQTLRLNIQAALGKVPETLQFRNRYVATMIRGLAGIPSVATLDALLDVRRWIEEASDIDGGNSASPESSSRELAVELLGQPAESLKNVLRRDPKQRWKPVLAEFGKVASPDRKAALADLLSMSQEELFGKPGPSRREPENDSKSVGDP